MVGNATASLVTKARPNDNAEGAAFIITLLERYVDAVPERTSRELLLARRIDAHDGGRATVEEAVRLWRALPQERRIATVGAVAAAADHRMVLDDAVLAQRAAVAFRPRLVRDATGVAVRSATAARSPLGAAPFTMPLEQTAPGRVVSAKSGEQPGEDETDAGDRAVSGVVGNPPEIVTTAAAGQLYRIDWVGIYCDEESTWDGGSNSDEPYFAFSLFDDHNRSWGKRSAVYSDVDSNEIRGAKPATTLWGPAYLPTDVTFLSTLAMERDWGNPDKVQRLWNDAAHIGACIAKLYGVDVDAAVVDSAANLLNEIFNIGDDTIGWDTMAMWPEGLEWFSNHWITWKGLTYSFYLFHTDYDSEYYSFYLVRRL